MTMHRPSRLSLGAALLSLCAVVPASARILQKTPPPPAVLKPNRPEQRPGTRAVQNQHLGQWMENHKALTPADQRRALQNEPGFHELPQQVQERELQQLDRLNSM